MPPLHVAPFSIQKGNVGEGAVAAASRGWKGGAEAGLIWKEAWSQAVRSEGL